jgi:hypothetical protein
LKKFGRLRGGRKSKKAKIWKGFLYENDNAHNDGVFGFTGWDWEAGYG